MILRSLNAILIGNLYENLLYHISRDLSSHISRSKELQRRNYYVEPVAIRYALDGILG